MAITSAQQTSVSNWPVAEQSALQAESSSRDVDARSNSSLCLILIRIRDKLLRASTSPLLFPACRAHAANGVKGCARAAAAAGVCRCPCLPRHTREVVARLLLVKRHSLGAHHTCHLVGWWWRHPATAHTGRQQQKGGQVRHKKSTTVTHSCRHLPRTRRDTPPVPPTEPRVSVTSRNSAGCLTAEMMAGSSGTDDLPCPGGWLMTVRSWMSSPGGSSRAAGTQHGRSGGSWRPAGACCGWQPAPGAPGVAEDTCHSPLKMMNS
jgi:hypothetical protein